MGVRTKYKKPLVKYYMMVKNTQEQHPYISKMELNMDKKGYTLTKVTALDRATVYEKQDVVLMFATDPSLEDKVNVYEVVYSEMPVVVTLEIGCTMNQR